MSTVFQKLFSVKNENKKLKNNSNLLIKILFLGCVGRNMKITIYFYLIHTKKLFTIKLKTIFKTSSFNLFVL